MSASSIVTKVDREMRKHMRAFVVIGITPEGQRVVLGHAVGEADTKEINEMFAHVTTQQLLGSDETKG